MISLTPAIPFDLDGLEWSSDGGVARTSDLDVARAAQERLFGIGLSLIESEQLNGHVYRFTYAPVGYFIFGGQVCHEASVDLYYFGSQAQLPVFALVAKDGVTEQTVPSYDEAERLRDASRQELDIKPLLVAQ